MKKNIFIIVLSLIFINCDSKKKPNLFIEIEEKKSSKINYIITENDIIWIDISKNRFEINDSVNNFLIKNNLLYNNSSFFNIYFKGDIILKLDLDCNCGNYIKSNKTKVYQLNNSYNIYKFSTIEDSLSFKNIEFSKYLESVKKLKE